MCLIAIRLAGNSRWPVVIAANRDEAHARPTDAAHWWPGESPAIFAGRDRLAGGSWLGIARSSTEAEPSGLHLRIAALTNVRPGLMPVDPQHPSPPQPARSRGLLVSSWLRAPAEQAPEPWLRTLAAGRDDYAGFNLVAIAGRISGANGPAPRQHWQAAVLSNGWNQPPAAMADGLWMVTNGLPGDPWPKTRRLGEAVIRSLDQAEADAGRPAQAVDPISTGCTTARARPADGESSLIDALLLALADRQEANPGEQPPTGLSADRERTLSAVFIADEHYGTRASTVILVRHDGRVRIVEQAFGPWGRPGNRVDEAFDAGPRRR